MNSVLKDGACVSCGREPGRHYRRCPYCGEEVWCPLWRSAARAALLAAPPALTALLAAATQPDWMRAVQALRVAHPAVGFLFASGVGVLLMPCADSDLVVSSRAEQVRWQALAVGGGALCGAYAALSALCLGFGRTSGAGAVALGGAVLACVAAAPFFFRIPRRALAAAAMIVAAITLVKTL